MAVAKCVGPNVEGTATRRGRAARRRPRPPPGPRPPLRRSVRRAHERHARLGQGRPRVVRARSCVPSSASSRSSRRLTIDFARLRRREAPRPLPRRRLPRRSSGRPHPSRSASRDGACPDRTIPSLVRRRYVLGEGGLPGEEDDRRGRASARRRRGRPGLRPHAGDGEAWSLRALVVGPAAEPWGPVHRACRLACPRGAGRGVRAPAALAERAERMRSSMEIRRRRRLRDSVETLLTVPCDVILLQPYDSGRTDVADIARGPPLLRIYGRAHRGPGWHQDRALRLRRRGHAGIRGGAPGLGPEAKAEAREDPRPRHPGPRLPPRVRCRRPVCFRSLTPRCLVDALRRLDVTETKRRLALVRAACRAASIEAGGQAVELDAALARVDADLL